MLDVLQTVLWMLTSTMILAGSIKYKMPLIPPQAQTVAAAFEISVFAIFVGRGQLGFDYVSIAYLYWTTVEIMLIFMVIKIGYIEKDQIFSYLIKVTIVTGVVYGAILYTDNIYAFSYFTTYIAELIWFGHILRRKDKLKPIEFVIFLTKFVADVVAVPVYKDLGDIVNQFTCVTLPILDFAFLIVYFIKKRTEIKKVN